MPIRAVIFDKDGTLLDFTATFGPAAYHVLADLAGGDAECLADLAGIAGYIPAERRFSKDSILLAHATNDYAPPLAERIGAVCDDAFLARIDRLFESHSIADATLFDDAEATLRRLRDAGIVIGCITNDTESCARAQLAAVGVDGSFVDVIGYDSGHGRKPDPGQIQAFAAKTGIDCGAIAVVGDSLHDMRAARTAGALAIAVTTGLQDAAMLTPDADHVVAALAEILPIVGVAS